MFSSVLVCCVVSDLMNFGFHMTNMENCILSMHFDPLPTVCTVCGKKKLHLLPDPLAKYVSPYIHCLVL